MTTIAAIETIRSTHSPTSMDPHRRETGAELMVQAVAEQNASWVGLDWRTLPSAILYRFAELCLEREAAEKRSAQLVPSEL